MEWRIPAISPEGGQLNVEIGASDRVFIVGSNGSGKSALIHHFVQSNRGARMRRIAAHRQTWLNSGAINLTPKSRREAERRFTSDDARPDSRWVDHQSAAKLSAVLFDLVANENARARQIAGHVDNYETDEAEKASAASRSPFAQLNELLALGTLTVALENSKDEEILARHKGGEPFSIAKLSDGERNAIIIAATVLTVEPETILLIDEPERHLHRAIVEPFLSALFEQRTDCAFVVSTHEIALPAASRGCKVLMPRSCEWNGDTPRAWDIQVLEPDAPLPEELKLAILGSRRRILFVEGKLESLDRPLYSALFPGLSVVPKEGCTGVQRAVAGLRGAYDHHHVEAFGLIDRDDRTSDQVHSLASSGVFALDVHSAEALYYGSCAVHSVACRQAESLGSDSDEMVQIALSSALGSLREKGVAERMAARRCERTLKERILSEIPDYRAIQDNGVAEITLSVTSPFPEEVAHFNSLLDADDWNRLVARYPLRETSAFKRIAQKLECTSQSKYEQMVLIRVQADVDLADKLRAQIGELSRNLEAAVAPTVIATA